MAEKLTDPNKPAHEIIEVLEDGDAIRNDGVRLQAANKNPWYVLATIYGEQEEGAKLWNYDEELAAKNRRAWNGWFCGELSDEERQDLAQKTRLEPHDLAPLSKEELDEIRKRFVARMGKGAKLPPNDLKINFSDTFFSKPFCADNMVYNKDAEFLCVVFNRSASFYSALFMGYANFESVTFDGDAAFSSAMFAGSSRFCFAIFRDDVAFNTTTFTGSSTFSEGMFNGFTDFGSAMFVNEVDFYSTTFMDSVVFSSATFTSSADFDSAIFKYWGVFYRARFSVSVPEFHWAQLHIGCGFSTDDNEQERWPPIKGQVKIGEKQVMVMPTIDQKQAYTRLRLLMKKSLRPDDEQFFQRQEMRCKSVLSKWYHKPFYWLYSGLSDCGNSVWRPLLWMLAVMLSGALFMLWWQEAFTFLPKESSGFDWTLGLLGEDDPWAKPRQAAGWSISNTLPFLGFGRLYYGELAKDLVWPLKVAGGVQTLLGYVLLFFFGLGLRNRFRLR
ncbi:pentapeptide repeat-containing protein [Profundibacter sp.]